MVTKALLVCVQALLIQSIAGQCINSRMAAPCSGAGLFSGSYMAGGLLDGPYGLGAPLASDGGAMPVSSASLYPASGVSILSENIFEGPLAVAGAMPFLGTVAVEGVLPTAGAGAVAYRCGNGEVGMLSEDIGGSVLGLSSSPLGYGAGLGQPLGASPFGPMGSFAGPAGFAAGFGAYGAGPYAANALGGLANSEAYGPAAAISNGGALPVTSASPVPPSGVNILSDNVYEGPLSLYGAMPFLGTAAVEGVLPSAGAGAVAYGCGNGDVAMLSENFGGFAGAYNLGFPANGLYGCGARI